MPFSPLNLSSVPVLRLISHILSICFPGTPENTTRFSDLLRGYIRLSVITLTAGLWHCEMLSTTKIIMDVCSRFLLGTGNKGTFCLVYTNILHSQKESKCLTQTTLHSLVILSPSHPPITWVSSCASQELHLISPSKGNTAVSQE